MPLTKSFPTSAATATKLGRLLFCIFPHPYNRKSISQPWLGAGVFSSCFHFLHTCTLNTILDKLTQIWPTSQSATATKCGKFLDFYGKLAYYLTVLLWRYHFCFSLQLNAIFAQTLTCMSWVIWRRILLHYISCAFSPFPFHNSSKQWVL